MPLLARNVNGMTNALTEFCFGGKVVRTFGDKLEPWFAAVDIFKSLDIRGNYLTRTLEQLDDDEKMLVNLSTGTQIKGEKDSTQFEGYLFEGGYSTKPVLWLVSEPGLYKIIFRSNKAEAKAFTRFVTHEVLPSIRKHGFYANPKWGNIPKDGKWTLANGVKLTALQVQQRALEIGCSNVEDRRIQSLVNDIDYYNSQEGIKDRYPYTDEDIQKMSKIGIGQDGSWYECFIPEGENWDEYCYWKGNDYRYSDKFAELVRQVDERELSA